MKNESKQQEKNIAITAERAIMILDILENHDIPVPLKEITEKIGLSQTAVFRLISTLEKSGFVHRSYHPKGYTLGWRIATMANTMLRQMSHVDIVNRHLRELASDTNQTASLHMLSGYSSVCVASHEGMGRLIYRIPIGQVSPIIRGAGGKSIMAFRISELARAKEAAERGLRVWNTADTMPSIEELTEIRRRGLSFSAGELVTGVSSMASPIFSTNQAVIGSISISGPTSDWNRDTMQPWQDELRRRAWLISESFGATSRPPFED